MAKHRVTFLPSDRTLEVPTGTLISETIHKAGFEILQPCGGQGRCGRCVVIVDGAGARRRSTLRLSSDDLAEGHALACQTVIEGDLRVTIPEQERVERRLLTDKTAAKAELPFPYDPDLHQSIRAFQLLMQPPSLGDSRDDLSRVRDALAAEGYATVDVPLPVLTQMGEALRSAEWSPWVVLESDTWFLPDGPARLVAIEPDPITPMGLAVDIGTTTVTIYLVDLRNREVLSSAAEYNDQIACGEDVISRIIYASKGDGLLELAQKVRHTIATLVERIQRRTGVSAKQIHKVTVSGNTTMIHLLLGIPPASIRLTPYIPAANRPQPLTAGELGFPANPAASVDCLPGVASYVGADITAGVLTCGLSETDQLTLFIDVGTNGEIVLGTRDWMVACATSAGPAFEGAGVVHGMRATEGAIEEVWISSATYDPTCRVIGNVRPRGICGSGLISLLAELFVTGVVDRGGNFKLDLGSPRVRVGDHGPEYVIAWAQETETGADLTLTKVDVDNLMRAKAAVYAGFSVLARSVGIDLADVQQVLVGGAFGKYINVEKAVQIGLLPDLPWPRFRFLGNTSVMGAYMALLSRDARRKVLEIAQRMTYIELSADNTFYEAFMAAMFLPHTEIARFPSVAEVWLREEAARSRAAATEPAQGGS